VKLGIDVDGVLAAYQTAYDIHGGLEWWKPEVYIEAEPVKGALDAVRELSTQHKLVAITARAEHPATNQWLNEHGFGSYISELHHTKQKWNVPCHIYLDDGAQFLNGIYERGLVGVRYRYPHNANAFAKYSVNDWTEFVALIRSGVRGKLRINPRKIRSVTNAR